MHKAILFGVAVGDALGVPVEFKSRDFLRANPVRDMIGYGTHNQPPGTWSDDSSLTFCLAEALTTGFRLETLARNFTQWLYHNYWTPHGQVFDIGNGTSIAIQKLRGGIPPEEAGGAEESDNGNGSLMRILPLLPHIMNQDFTSRFSLTRQVSSLTHRHIRSVIACFYYLEFARLIVENPNKHAAYARLQSMIPGQLQPLSIQSSELSHFDRLLHQDIYMLPENCIASSGYVLHTLEASIWCLLTTQNYEDAVLKAVNLGHDTDTTAAVTGGLAGLLYGYDSIPEKWITHLARRSDIDNLANRWAASHATR